MVVTDFGQGTYAEANAAVYWPSSKVVVAGHTHVNGDIAFLLARYSTVDGTLDPTFGNGGRALDFWSGGFAIVNAVARRGNRILAAGVAGSDGAVAQYTEDGDNDFSFGMWGKVTTGFGADDVFNAVGVVQQVFAPTRVVAAGTTGTFSPNSHDFAVAMYDSSGVPLSTFGSAGTVKIGFSEGRSGPTDDFGTSLATQTNGKVIVGGYTHAGNPCVTNESNFALARLNADGTLDPTFGGDGKVVTDVGGIDHLNAIRIQATNGRIVGVGGTRASCSGEVHLALVRYHPNGLLDASFGTGGIAVVNFDSTLTEIGTDLQILANGKIVVSARSYPLSGANGFNAMVARFMPDGTPDPSFGLGGRAMLHAGDENDYTYADALVIDSAGGALPVGSFVPSSGSGAGFFLGRFTPLGEPDTSFGQ
jgi:uncharacterized delta-60 repeat protein